MDSENCNARPLRVTQSDSRSDELKRRVTTATPVRSPMEQGKEPSQRSFELTAHEWVRQEDIAHPPRFAGDFAWRLSGSHADAHGGPRTADYDCLRARFRANIWILAQHMGRRSRRELRCRTFPRTLTAKRSHSAFKRMFHAGATCAACPNKNSDADAAN